MTTTQRETVHAWRAGARRPSVMARYLGIRPAAARQRIRRARLRGLLEEAAAPLPATPAAAPASRLRQVTLSALVGGAWRYLGGETMTVMHAGQAIAEWRPTDAPPQITAGDGSLPVFMPEPELELRLARLEYEAGRALAEVEEVRDELHPGERLVTSKRTQEAIRRRTRWARLKTTGEAR